MGLQQKQIFLSNLYHGGDNSWQNEPQASISDMNNYILGRCHHSLPVVTPGQYVVIHLFISFSVKDSSKVEICLMRKLLTKPLVPHTPEW